NGEIQVERAMPLSLQERERGKRPGQQQRMQAAPSTESRLSASTPSPDPSYDQKSIRVYTYGVNRNRLEKAAKRMHTPAHLVKHVAEADLMITTKEFYRQRTKVIKEAEQRDLPIYVLRNDTIGQMQSCLNDIFDGRSREPKPLDQALTEAEEAIQRVLDGEPEVVLSPQNAYVRRRQHELARSADLVSRSRGKEPNRQVRICQG
ncbi:MAG: hypothetical protein KGY78_05345, partial [Anaerolineae bacterium]|nr:hypothetical protein [Anaerolineae bacterium]